MWKRLKRREFVRRDLWLLMGQMGRTERIGRLWRGWSRTRTIYYNMEEVKVNKYYELVLGLGVGFDVGD